MASCWINFLQEYQKTKVQKACKDNNFKQYIRNICNATNKFKINAINDATTWPKKSWRNYKCVNNRNNEECYNETLRESLKE
jgi:hypothetical protein